MSLKTDYLDGANGFTTKMANVFIQGESLITTNLAVLTTQLRTFSAQGVKKFTVNLTGVFEPQNLRLKGVHMNTYFAGIKAGLMAQDIYDYEVTVALNTADTINTSVDLTFTF
jgi:hypothetical protein